MFWIRLYDTKALKLWSALDMGLNVHLIAGKETVVSGGDIRIPSLYYVSFSYTYRSEESHVPGITLLGVVCIFEVMSDDIIKMTAASPKFSGTTVFRET